MKHKEIWANYHASICSIKFLDVTNNRISSGTGFKVDNYLITNNHVIQIPNATFVDIVFVKNDGHSINSSKRFSIIEFKSNLVDGLPESSWDFAIFKLDCEEFNIIPSLTLSKQTTFDIASEVSVIGFQFDNENLSIKSGIISSYYNRNSVDYLEIDCSVNQGNSGGPLICNDTGEVIGVVTRKNTGLSRLFDVFHKQINDMVDRSYIITHDQDYRRKNKIDIGVHNTNVAMYNVGIKLRAIAQEIKRSSNVGIGYAYQLTEISKFFNK